MYSTNLKLAIQYAGSVSQANGQTYSSVEMGQGARKVVEMLNLKQPQGKLQGTRQDTKTSIAFASWSWVAVETGLRSSWKRWRGDGHLPAVSGRTAAVSSNLIRWWSHFIDMQPRFTDRVFIIPYVFLSLAAHLQRKLGLYHLDSQPCPNNEILLLVY